MPAPAKAEAYYQNTTKPRLFNQYFMLSGSSTATPVVGGVAALMLQKDSTLTPDQVKARLMKTAWKGFPSYVSATDPKTGVAYNIEEDIFAAGAGAVDASAALANTDFAPATVGSAKSPIVNYDPSDQHTHYCQWPCDDFG